METRARLFGSFGRQAGLTIVAMGIVGVAADPARAGAILPGSERAVKPVGDIPQTDEHLRESQAWHTQPTGAGIHGLPELLHGDITLGHPTGAHATRESVAALGPPITPTAPKLIPGTRFADSTDRLDAQSRAERARVNGFPAEAPRKNVPGRTTSKQTPSERNEGSGHASPFATGACCQNDGTCTEAASAPECNASWGHCTRVPSLNCAIDDECIMGQDDLGPCVPRFLALGSDCDVNCCPVGEDTGGDCCEDRYACMDTAQFSICDPLAPGSWPPNCGSCEQVCWGPTVFNIVVPSAISELELVIDITSDTRNSVENPADSCALGTETGWYHKWHIDSCAILTWTFCCSEPYMDNPQTVLIEGCPCTGPIDSILPDPGRNGFGPACGNDHCCEDGNYSVEWTARAGTYHYSPNTASFCENSGDPCSDALGGCPLGELCLSKKQPYQAHLYVRGCPIAACCITDPATGDADCSHRTKTGCQDAGGIYLGDLEPNPIVDCSFAPCAQGACCLPEGGCEDNGGQQVTPEECQVDDGDYWGGVLCANQPCPVCKFESPGHCQLDTGQFLFPSDRRQGTRRADDFIPIGAYPQEDLYITRVCYEFGFNTTNPPPECSDNPPIEYFHVHFYEDEYGFPGTELPESANTNPEDFHSVDRAESKGPGLSTWRFSGPVGPSITGVRVSSGECYWIEVTGLGTADCQTLWAHSRDGNNYGMRDDDNNWGQEDARAGDVVFCLDIEMQAATVPGVDGGCGIIPAACCYSDGTCDDDFPTMNFNQCNTFGGNPVVGGSCDEPCPIDCNGNGIPDELDIAGGESQDCNANGIPDECETLDPGDANGDGDFDLGDFSVLQSCFTGEGAIDMDPCCRIFDFGPDDDVDLDDYGAFQTELTGPQ